MARLKNKRKERESLAKPWNLQPTDEREEDSMGRRVHL
jgi:hypothetical protein